MLPDDPENFKGRVIDLLRWGVKGKAYGEDFVERIAIARGREFAERLKTEATRQWRGGNNGYGEWIE